MDMSIFIEHVSFSVLPQCTAYKQCLWKRAELTSKAFDIDFSTVFEEYWYIKSAAFTYLILRFERFHVECNVKSMFDVEITNMMRLSFCNTNKPVEGIKSIYGHLVIKSRFLRDTYRLPEGFKATFEVLSKSFSSDYAPTQEWIGKHYILSSLCLKVRDYYVCAVCCHNIFSKYLMQSFINV